MELLSKSLPIALLVFAITSMLAVGLNLTSAQILAPLRNTTAPRRKIHLLAVLFFLLGLPVFAKQNGDSFKKEPDQEAAEQAKTEAQAPDQNSSAGDLAKAVQNPVASLISVPIQNNFNPNIAPDGRNQWVLNIQPVIPMRINENWNLIARVITPVVYQPTLPDQGVIGLGDINPTFFFSPVHVGKLIWGVGPSIVLPTATNKLIGQGKWSLGPSVVALVQPGHWTIGALVYNVWSVGGQSDRVDVNQMLLQYFINYNLHKGWYLSTSPIVTANWIGPSNNRWVVPVGGGVGRVFRLGFQPVNATIQVYGNAEHPDGVSPWGLRVQLAFLYPKMPKKN
jgi:hypothetical protein